MIIGEWLSFSVPMSTVELSVCNIPCLKCKSNKLGKIGRQNKNFLYRKKNTRIYLKNFTLIKYLL